MESLSIRTPEQFRPTGSATRMHGARPVPLSGNSAGYSRAIFFGFPDLDELPGLSELAGVHFGGNGILHLRHVFIAALCRQREPLVCFDQIAIDARAVVVEQP